MYSTFIRNTKLYKNRIKIQSRLGYHRSYHFKNKYVNQRKILDDSHQ